jgi:hypothetical protein
LHSAVARICNPQALPDFVHPCKPEAAGNKPAIQQIENLRYNSGTPRFEIRAD